MIWMDILLFILLITCGYTDLRYQRVPNIVLLPAALLSLILHLWQGGIEGFFSWSKGLGVGVALFLLPFLWGGIGAGDVKLLGVIGALKGTTFVFYSFLATAFIGGLISVGILLYQGKLTQTFKQIGMSLKIFFYSRLSVWNMPGLDEESKSSVVFPYGIAIVLGTIMTYWVM
ncbi:MAG: peptidase prepilin type [Peptococcaceae bacterium]|jgi:prepilin peptidase CpaA|nr:peptidase prepilin type [Peptococcaceae bacterium]